MITTTPRALYLASPIKAKKKKKYTHRVSSTDLLKKSNYYFLTQCALTQNCLSLNKQELKLKTNKLALKQTGVLIEQLSLNATNHRHVSF